MFHKHDIGSVPDLSFALREYQDWQVGSLRSFPYLLDVTALAIEPISGILAIGARCGKIYIFGSPGVVCVLSLPEPIQVKFLQFAPSILRLACLDTSSRLHIWDLENYGQPKLLTSARFDQANSLTLSPSHLHAFVGLESGIVKTYDVLCLRKSPYSIPNMWSLYEEKMAASGMPDVLNPTNRIALDVVVHPRDLNLLLVAYSGGVVLSDLTQRNTLRVYDLIIPAGAPGGAGYGSKDLLTHRKPSVTALAVHPSGHYFAVGHSDGTIAFWALEDEDQPLLVRTLNELDVNIVDGHKLDGYLSQDPSSKPPTVIREPIFKLAWSGFPNSSDPRGGCTALTILGGTDANEAPGLYVHWLPAFNPDEPPSADAQAYQNRLHPYFRKAMRNSVIPLNTYIYPTTTIVQDFLLIPRDNPHFNGAYDAISILLLTEGPGSTRLVEGHQFPPPSLVNTGTKVTGLLKQPDNDNDPSLLVDELASTLEALEMDEEPKPVRLPSLLEYGRNLVGGRLLKLEREKYQLLASEAHNMGLSLALRGGAALLDENEISDFKTMKYQSHRILITCHRDLTIKFQDASPHLLATPDSQPILVDFPNPLPSLTIDLKPILVDSAVIAKTSPTFMDETFIESAQLASESLECAISFQTGEVMVFRLGSGTHEVQLYEQVTDEELVLLKHVLTPQGQKFIPYLMLTSKRGPITSYAISDIGFLAVAYVDGSLIVVDMRGPMIILRHDTSIKSKTRHSIGIHIYRQSSTIDPIECLTWTVSTFHSDPQLRIRLIAVRASGVTNTYTFARNPTGAWTCAVDPITFESVEKPLPGGSFLINSKTGDPLYANPEGVAATFRPGTVDLRGLLVACGAKGARCLMDVNGDQIGKVSWNSSKMGVVQSVQVVERKGSYALVAFTNLQNALVYSLPKLEYLHTLKLPSMPSSSLSADVTGDFIIWNCHPTAGTVSEALYGTLFDIRRHYGLPDIDFTSTRPTVPSQPQPISVGPASILSSWLPFGQQSITGEQLDNMLGGPDRPLPELKTPISRSISGRDGGDDGSSLSATVTSASSNLYGRLQSALSERGQMLGDLDERFTALEQGSRSMVAQAKRLATEQTARRWFTGF